ncbi:hypothetical protein FAZ69_13285 [Trinickia terrae]|uniref:Uncharacterized protein n=1 Tax=Trinickia terrae TaxID=2571161 RepID=A0A4V5PIU2_9BURK|nr:hypothetical protein [Trinickia terrae]TKC88720.1 hypothetical protein FAZ69_13285 [Trinickia terrae]
MIKKPEDLKNVFVNGAIPTQMDFADLIDSFVPKDQLPDADLQALRELIGWWRSRDAGAAPGSGTSGSPANPGSGTPAPGVSPTPPVAPGSGASPGSGAAPAGDAGSGKGPGTAAPPSDSTGASCTVPADGNWHPLPITDKTVGTWTCTASTVNARPSYRITNSAIAVVGKQLSARRLVQSVDRDSLIPWHVLQFKWLPESGSSFQLNVRARSAFGPDAGGKQTQILCRWARQD